MSDEPEVPADVNRDDHASDMAAFQRAASQVGDLVDSVDLLTEAVKSMRAQRKRDRVVTAVGVGIIALGVANAVYTAHRVNQVQDDTTYANCVNGNQFRQQQRQLWDGIAALPRSGPPPSQETLRQFNELLDRTFFQRDCEHDPLAPAPSTRP